MSDTVVSFRRGRTGWSLLQRAVVEVADSVWGLTAGRRKRAMLQMARGLDLTYHAAAVTMIPRWVARFPLFQLGRGGALLDGLQGRFLNAPVRIFDYCPSGGTWRTVVVFELRHNAVPRFALWPSGAAVDPSDAIGRSARQLGPTGNQGFDDRYHVYASNESAVRSLFPKRALEYFETHGGWRVEGGGRWIAIYREGERAQPRKLRGFLMDVFQAFRPLRLG